MIFDPPIPCSQPLAPSLMLCMCWRGEGARNLLLSGTVRTSPPCHLPTRPPACTRPTESGAGVARAWRGRGAGVLWLPRGDRPRPCHDRATTVPRPCHRPLLTTRIGEIPPIMDYGLWIMDYGLWMRLHWRRICRSCLRVGLSAEGA